MLEGLLGVALIIGAIFLCIWSTANDMGMSISQWLEVCDNHSKEEGKLLKDRYL